ncbi:hypothetical protein TRAPUB_3192 [Trametes pubescens]|uniref:Uncharacterized protein n=1 Tax=Trametes pubescens TaxID=154538 RepID=A0A1M2VEI3_TRAPU|nr:hypothetical protein TRAPUB_3192 [Trametes pubescens]
MSKPTRGKREALRHLLNLIKPAPTLGKRSRDDEDEPTEARLPPSAGPSATPCAQPACIALQNVDTEEDAIVITALTAVPFCCHADLVTMNRAALLTVASTLNAKLPLAMQIDVGASRSDAFIRNSIELLVGIRSEMPPLAPKRIRSRSVFEASQFVPPSPASPLAGRSRPSTVLGTPGLSTLREESEGRSRGSDERPQKRRRTVLRPSTPTFDPRRPITRSQSHRVAPLVAGNAESPTANARVLRTRSQNLPERPPLYPILHDKAAVTMSRGRGRTMARGLAAKRPSFAMTSTPKKRALAAVNSPASVVPRYNPIMADPGNKGTFAFSRLSQSKTGEETAHSEEITFGIDGLTMAINDSGSSDMDISSD